MNSIRTTISSGQLKKFQLNFPLRFLCSPSVGDIRDSLPAHLRPKILDSAVESPIVDKEEELQSHWASVDKRLQFRRHKLRDESNKNKPSRGNVGISAWDGGGHEYLDEGMEGSRGVGTADKNK